MLLIGTTFSLNETSVKLDIKYNCLVSDYCDIEFDRETLTPALAEMNVESIRQHLVVRLYNPSNTEPIQCRNNESCFQNTSLCFISYVYWSSFDNIHLNGVCQNLEDMLSIE